LLAKIVKTVTFYFNRSLLTMKTVVFQNVRYDLINSWFMRYCFLWELLGFANLPHFQQLDIVQWTNVLLFFTRVLVFLWSLSQTFMTSTVVTGAAVLLRSI